MIPYQPLQNYSTGRFPNETYEQAKWREVKETRNALLTLTDWTVNNDSPLPSSKIEEYKEYRQALRNIPQNFAKPQDVVWPTKPE